jgi:hypothetical protein
VSSAVEIKVGSAAVANPLVPQFQHIEILKIETPPVPITGRHRVLRIGLAPDHYEERVMGLEPTISCLGSKRSTTELHPQGGSIIPNFLYFTEFKDLLLSYHAFLFNSIRANSNNASPASPCGSAARRD